MGRAKEVENLNSSEVACTEDAQFLAFARHGGIRREHHDLPHTDISQNKDVE
jgi:hypothetical protein